MLLCVSSRESSEVLSAATGEVQVVAGASFKFGDTGAVGVEGLGCGLDTEPCFGASSRGGDRITDKISQVHRRAPTRRTRRAGFPIRHLREVPIASKSAQMGFCDSSHDRYGVVRESVQNISRAGPEQPTRSLTPLSATSLSIPDEQRRQRGDVRASTPHWTVGALWRYCRLRFKSSGWFPPATHRAGASLGEFVSSITWCPIPQQQRLRGWVSWCLVSGCGVRRGRVWGGFSAC